MALNRNKKDSRFLRSALLMGGSIYLLQYSGPLLMGAEINGLSAALLAVALNTGAGIVSDVLWRLGNQLDKKSAKTPVGTKGTAGFVQSLDEISHDLIQEGWGPYWGMFEGKEVMAEIGCNSVWIGTTGASKGVAGVQMNIMTIRGSKVVSDLKSENACITARVLRERGENVRILNLGGINTDILGDTDYYNPLCLFADNYWRAGGLMDVSDDSLEFVMQLVQEPAENDDESENTHFRNGSRTILGFTMQMCVMIHGYEATLGHVAAMLNDKKSLIRHAKWACGELEKSEEVEDLS